MYCMHFWISHTIFNTFFHYVCYCLDIVYVAINRPSEESTLKSLHIKSSDVIDLLLQFCNYLNIIEEITEAFLNRLKIRNQSHPWVSTNLLFFSSGIKTTFPLYKSCWKNRNKLQTCTKSCRKISLLATVTGTCIRSTWCTMNKEVKCVILCTMIKEVKCLMWCTMIKEVIYSIHSSHTKEHM